LPVFHGRLEPDRDLIAALGSRKVLAFAGIGDPQKFFATLAEANVSIGTRRSFPDHHRYTRADALSLVTRAAHEGLVLLTTEKDLARLKGDAEAGNLAERALALPASLRLDEENTFRKLVLRSVGKA
jgi:tetraacyldisaccharide 4'-kinase